MESYLAYRRAGGESHAELAAVYTFAAAALRLDERDEAVDALGEARAGGLSPQAAAVVDCLLALLAGRPAPAGAEVDYLDAAELRYLLDQAG